mmetsp:Transcript_3602/g.6125  ORF Transcript_3602/g.6125 Transcript_3602/m.6125 type:complete len:913 (-) Transcript_3602:36-2774(-)
MQAVECCVLRGGEWSVVDSKLLVPGDVVRVKMGDNVPADLRLVALNSVSFQVEEAPLTGESVSVQKRVEKLEAGDLLQDQKNMVFASTVVNYGSATGVVVFTGMNTAIGRVQKQVSEAAGEEEDTPLKKKIDAFGETLSRLIGAVCLLVWLMNYRNFYDEIHGSVLRGCIYYFKIAVALAVAAIPEGLPAVITTCLALGTRKMAQNNAIVRRLPSVETLGCTTVICSDKTGTLTKNEMVAVQFAVVDGAASQLRTYSVDEPSHKNLPAAFSSQPLSSYIPIGCQVRGQSSDFGQDYAAHRELFDSIALGCTVNNNASVSVEGTSFKRMGEPTEAALKVLAEKISGQPKDVSSAFSFSEAAAKRVKTIAQLDFTSERKAMSSIVSGHKNEKDLLLKGAPDRVIQKCTSIMGLKGTKPMEAQDRFQLMAQVAKLQAQGLRCLALAEVPEAGSLAGLTEANKGSLLADPSRYSEFEQGATFLGVVCIKDPVREGIDKCIAQCKTAGIKVIMITGDSKETAKAIARDVGILVSGDSAEQRVFTGDQFEAMSEQERTEALRGDGGRVFARVEPAHKRELVKCLIAMDEIVAMTGDGVNDAPALKQAHIGIAMGVTGTEVAKSASDMVLADDNFATIVKAVEEGRSIYSNMKAFIRYLISSNIGEVLSIFLTAALGVPEGFSSVQLLWVNLVTDGPPATALGFNPPDLDIMKKPPRRQDDELISGWVLVRYCVIGAYVGLATVGIFVYWYVFATTADQHTLVSWHQLSHWGECPNWSREEFQPAAYMEGLDFAQNPCLYFTQGKVKASTLSLTVLVVIEMLNALNAISEDNSLFRISPFVNPFLLLAIAGSLALHALILYVPFLARIFGIVPLDAQEWLMVLAFSAPVLVVDELLKVVARQMNAKELRERLAGDKKKH